MDIDVLLADDVDDNEDNGVNVDEGNDVFAVDEVDEVVDT